MDFLPDYFSQERRFAERYPIRTALRVRARNANVPEKRAVSQNLSRRGIFFVTNSQVAIGDVLEILLKMPEEITGEPTTEWRCTGRVARVEQVDPSRGTLGVGVHFYCYDVSRAAQPPRPAAGIVAWRMPMHAA